MTTFTGAAIEYLCSQPLGRLATVGAGGRPQVDPAWIRVRPRRILSWGIDCSSDEMDEMSARDVAPDRV
ncbi:MAG: hypothetical protein ACRDRY_05155 [Pseudonocardiaceae bacterium]